MGDVPLAAEPDEDGAFLVGPGDETWDVPRYQSMTGNPVERWRRRPDLLQETRDGMSPPWARCRRCGMIGMLHLLGCAPGHEGQPWRAGFPHGQNGLGIPAAKALALLGLRL